MGHVLSQSVKKVIEEYILPRNMP